ncbi:MAG: DUF6318 family protein [Dermatophilaceae bacterium]
MTSSTARTESGATAPTTSRPTTATTPGPSTPTTQSATDAGADELAARFPRTAAGAKAFVRAYFDALGKAFAAGDPAGLSTYSTPACLRCEGFLRTLTADHDQGRHGVGTFAIIHRVTATAVTDTSAVVDVDFDSPAAYVVDAQGTRVDERTAELSLRLRVRLEHSDHWRIVATELNP